MIFKSVEGKEWFVKFIKITNYDWLSAVKLKDQVAFFLSCEYCMELLNFWVEVTKLVEFKEKKVNREFRKL